MRIGEAEAALPNGLHDAFLTRFAVDYEARTAEFEFLAWVGDVTSQDDTEREKHQRAKLLIRGLRFLILEGPDPTYNFQRNVPTIDGFSAWGGDFAPPDNIKKLIEKLPASAFYEATFVEDWNSFIHIGADDAEISLIEQ